MITKLSFFLLFLLFPLGQLLKIPLWGKVGVLPQEIVLFILLARFVILGQWRKLRQVPLTKEISIFIAVVLLSLLFTPLHLTDTDLAEAVSYLGRFILYFGVYLVAYFELQKKVLTKEFLYHGLLISAVIFSLFGLVQYFLYPTLSGISYLGWDIHNGRLVATFLDPGFTGLIFILGFFLLLNKPFKKIAHPLTLFRMAIGTLFLICLLLTYSRSSWLAFGVGLGVYAFIKRGIKLSAVAAGLFLVGILLIPKPQGEGGNLARTASSLARVGDWQITLSIWQHEPLFGVGFNAYRFARAQYGFLPPNRPEVREELLNHSLGGADNSFLFILATMGIFGLLAFLNLGWQIIKNIKSDKAIVFASLGAIVVHTFFQNSLFYPFVMEWIWIMAAMTIPSSDSG